MVKTRFALLLCLLAAVLAIGCGSLRKPTSFDGLSKEAMNFVDQQDKSANYTWHVGHDKYYSNQGASKIVPAIPFFYLKTLAKGPDEYYLSRFFWTFPIHGSMKFGLFNTDGYPIMTYSKSGIYATLIEVMSVERTVDDIDLGIPDKKFKFRLLYGLLGFGTDYFKLLWIPIVK